MSVCVCVCVCVCTCKEDYLHSTLILSKTVVIYTLYL